MLTDMNVARVVLCAGIVVCLWLPISETSSTGCVKCPNGMECIRVEGSNLHLCVRRVFSNVTSSDNVTNPTQSDDWEPRIEGRAENSCPRPPVPPGPCVVQCRYHSDCRLGEECCSNGCGHTCTSVTPDDVTKPGSCPLVSRLDEEPCDIPCLGDADCPGQTKCCLSNCGLSCKAPCFHWLRNNGVINPWRLSRRCGGIVEATQH